MDNKCKTLFNILIAVSFIISGVFLFIFLTYFFHPDEKQGSIRKHQIVSISISGAFLLISFVFIVIRLCCLKSKPYKILKTSYDQSKKSKANKILKTNYSQSKKSNYAKSDQSKLTDVPPENRGLPNPNPNLNEKKRRIDKWERCLYDRRKNEMASSQSSIEFPGTYYNGTLAGSCIVHTLNDEVIRNMIDRQIKKENNEKLRQNKRTVISSSINVVETTDNI